MYACIISGLGKVKYFLSRALRLGQTRRPSAVARSSNEPKNSLNEMFK